MPGERRKRGRQRAVVQNRRTALCDLCAQLAQSILAFDLRAQAAGTGLHRRMRLRAGPASPCLDWPPHSDMPGTAMDIPARVFFYMVLTMAIHCDPWPSDIVIIVIPSRTLQDNHCLEMCYF